MSYASGTINSATPVAQFKAAVAALFTASGWTLAGSGTTASATYNYEVYKSAGGSNQCGYDWHVAIIWKEAGYFFLVAGDSYNPTTTELGAALVSGGQSMPSSKRPLGLFSAYNAGSSGLYPRIASFKISDCVASELNTGRVVSNTGFITGGMRFTPPASTAFGYWISVTKDHVVYGTTVAQGVGAAWTVALDAEYAAITMSKSTTPVFVVGTGYAENSLVAPMDQGNILFSGALQLTTSSADARGVNMRLASQKGPTLPTLTSDLGVATASRPIVMMSQPIKVPYSAGATDTTAFGGDWVDHIVVGRGIDLYRVRGGSIGDTVTIGSDQYVIITGFNEFTAAIPGASSPGISIAVKVE